MKTFKPCRVTVSGVRYEVNSDRVVTEIGGPGGPVHPDIARNVLSTVSRLRRNRARRDRYDAMRSLGMVKTPYGWE